jgi:hypothetical protein
MQFVAKDFLTLDLDGTPNDSSATWETERLLVASELAAESLRASGKLRLRVRGESMLPTLWPGDVVEIARCSVDDVRPDDIVLALREGRFFLHRIVAISGADGFLLRGDSMPQTDPEFASVALIGRLANCPRSLIPYSRVIGRLLCYCRSLRRFALRVHARRRCDQLRADDVACVGPYLAPARGQKCSCYTNLLELPRAGA